MSLVENLKNFQIYLATVTKTTKMLHVTKIAEKTT